MADETIGTARIEISGDASGVEAAAAKAKASISSMSSDAQASYSRLSGAEKRRADSLGRQQEAIKRTVIEQLRLNDALGTGGRALDDVLMRLTFNPVTAAAAAFVALGVAWKEGAGELKELQTTLTMAGGALGVTTGQVSGMAAEMGKMGDITRHEAAEALTQVAKSGKIAGDQMQEVATVAVRSAQLLGRSQQDVIAEFAAIGDDPVKAAKKLNEQYNFLTTAVYEQARALVEQGRTQDAVRLITDEFAGVTQRRLDDVEKSLGSLQRAWNWVGAEASKTWDLMLNIGRPQTLQNQIDDVQNAIDAQVKLIEGDTKIAQGQGRDYTSTAIDAAKKALPELQAKLADLMRQAAGVDFTASAKAAEAARAKEFTSAKDSLDNLRKSLRTREEMRDDEIANVKKWAKTVRASETEVADLVARIDKKYAERKTGGGRSKGKSRTILYDSLDDLIASPDVTSRMEAIQRDYDSIANLVGDRLTTAQQKYNRELEAMGQGDWARQVNSALQSIEDRYNSILEQRRNSSKGLSDEDEKRIRDAMDRELQMATDHYAQMKAKQADWALGAQDALANYRDQAANVYQSVGQLATKSFQGMTDALTDFVTTGKSSFSDLTNSMVRDMIRIMIQSQITGTLAGALGGGLRMFGAEVIANMSSDPIGSLIKSLGGPAYNNALGGVYDSLSLSAYSNQIHDTPKLFAFAHGAGVFGEAGPEAIMPLKRGPGGVLGVQAHGSTAPAAAPAPIINIINQSGQPLTASQPKVSMDAMGRQVISLVVSDISRNGPVAKAISGRYGLK